MVFAVRPSKDTPDGSSYGTLPVSFRSPEGSILSEGDLPVVIHERFGIEFPKSVHFGSTSPGERKRKRLMIRAADDRAFDVLEVTTSSGALKASANKSGSGIRHWLDVDFSADSEGEFNGTVTVRTNHPDCHCFDIAATAYVRSTSPQQGSLR
jgi:hypothetical protein